MTLMLVKKTPQNISIFRDNHPECYNCGKDLYDVIMQKDTKIWRKGTGTVYKRKFYCNECKANIFEGVKLRDKK